MGRPGKKQVRLGLGTPSGSYLFDDQEDGEAPLVAESSIPQLASGFDVNAPESSYARLVPVSHRRRLGQFFTPEPIANLLCRWTAEIQPQSMLDPAAGTGVLLRTFHRTSKSCRITALDVDPLVVQALRLAADPAWAEGIACRDFLTWNDSERFDAIVANPPYLRHHDLSYPPSLWRQIEQRSGVRLSRLTNSYVLFVLEICRRLRPGGRAAIIVPGEWLNANFGTALKSFLLEGNWLRQLVYFSHAETLFEDALTTACLLLIEHPHTLDPGYRLHSLFVESSTNILDLERLVLGQTTSAEGVTAREFVPAELLQHGKWNAVLEHGLPVSRPGFVPLGKLANTCRGIATGANSFFHLSLAEAKSKGLDDHHLKPCIGRARDVAGYVFQSADFNCLIDTDAATQLFCAEGTLSPPENLYLGKGEQAGLPERYLLSQRKPWYAMERREPAPIWAAVFGRSELRFVFNGAGIRNLTTFHAIYPRWEDGDFAKALTACLNSSIVQQGARLQHRVYGGGLLKFEPKDLLEIEVPDLRAVQLGTLTALTDCLAALDSAAKAENNEQRTSAMTRLNEAVLSAASEAVARSRHTELDDQFAPGLLWAQHKHRAVPAS